jgi:branched-subunit amino acid aminotransferase/4-amino-4-deoxychorismate lyase
VGCEGRAAVDGHVVSLDQAFLRITDDGAARGDGAFETIGVWDGRPFRVADHLRRLAQSLRALCLPEPDADRIAADIDVLVAGLGEADAMVRVYVTGSGTRVVTLSDQPVRPPTRHVIPQPAPWIRPLGAYSLAGAKTMSYAHNMAAKRAACTAGGDDALLLANEGWILEGSTFAVLWVSGGVVRAPAIDLGIVDSISRRTLLERSDAPVEEGRWTLDELAGASEVMISSALRDVESVRRVGDLRFDGPTPVRDAFSTALRTARLAQAD